MFKFRLKYLTMLIAVILISAINIPSLAAKNSNIEVPKKIIKIHTNWQSCIDTGDKIKINTFNYSLHHTERVDSTNNYIATYLLDEKIIKNFNTWKDCISFGDKMQVDGLQYNLIAVERIGKTDKFTATYILDTTQP